MKTPSMSVRKKRNIYGKMRGQRERDALIAVIMFMAVFAPRQGNGLELCGKRNVLQNKIFIQ